jgi:hypothetical protein
MLNWLFLLFTALLISIGVNFYQWLIKPEISVKKGLDEMKDPLIGIIVFYQGKYNSSDQLVLINKWIKDNIKKEDLKTGEWELFKDNLET